jgi:hypothetical protein
MKSSRRLNHNNNKMNIGKGLNISQFKKVFWETFTGARGFWISTGGVFAILAAIYFFLVHPLSFIYTKIYKDLDDLSVVLEKYIVKKDLYNNKWCDSKKLEAALYEKETDKCKEFLKKKDERLEAFFQLEDKEKGLIKIEDEALWKNEYIKRTSALIAKLDAQHIALSHDALPIQNWGTDIPTWDNILPVQKRFWIMEELVNIFLKDIGITQLDKISFRETAYTYNASLSQIYTIIPLTIQLELLADHIEFLLHEIHKSDIPFVIETATILSTAKSFNPGTSGEDEDSFSKNPSNPVINVTLDTYIIDYKI